MIKIILFILLFSSSCDDPEIIGCTSPSACNFNPNATKADASCVQPEGCNNWCPSMEGSPKQEDCLGECGGEAVYDDCDICDGDNSTCIDCEGTPNGTLTVDCNGICGGTAMIDDCGVCTGGNTINEPNYLKDCYGDCLGDAFIDDCGVCTGGNTGFSPNFLKDECGDCTNVENYNLSMDCSGVCSTDSRYSIANECENECENCGWKPTENCNDCESYGECVLFGSILDFCGICSGGISNHEANSDQDCNGICFGSSIEDCSGTCGGSLIEDECGTCGGSGFAFSDFDCMGNNAPELNGGISNNGMCWKLGLACDCNGNQNDECGICGGSGPGEGENCDGECIAEGENLDEDGYDCAGACGGNANLDDCGICNGDGYTLVCSGTENCNNMDCNGTCVGSPGFGAALDCAGICLGSASYGCDGSCCGGTTGLVCAETDECGVCDNNLSNDCVQDCNDEWGGSASIDNCGTCSGGNTGITPNQGATADGLYSCSDVNLLINAGICSDSNDCTNNTCPELLWSYQDQTYQELYGFNFAGCSINSIPNYIIDFNITTLNLSDNTFSQFPENIIEMNSLEYIDLRFNLISNIPNSICTLTNNPCVIDIRDNLIFDCNQIPDCNNAGNIICE